MDYLEIRKSLIIDKAKSGDYIILYKWTREWEELTITSLMLNIHQPKVLDGIVTIHKKHQNILNAYFENKTIELYFNGDWNTLTVDFIYSYARENEYRIKDENNIKNENNIFYSLYKQPTLLKTNYIKG